MTIFSIGHSNRSIQAFIKLLQQHNIEILIDVRSSPYSRYVPHFNSTALASAIEQSERKYPMGNHSGTRKCQIRRRTHGSLYDRFHEENSLPVLRLSKTSWHKAPCRRQAE